MREREELNIAQMFGLNTYSMLVPPGTGTGKSGGKRGMSLGEGLPISFI